MVGGRVGRRRAELGRGRPVSARNPSYAETNYAVRGPLVRWLRSEATRTSERTRILDVGCGVKPYEPFFRPYASYVGVDVGNPAADLEGAAEDLPVDDASFDLVLCTQTLEHCVDPARAVRELRRAVASGWARPRVHPRGAGVPSGA